MPLLVGLAALFLLPMYLYTTTYYEQSRFEQENIKLKKKLVKYTLKKTLVSLVITICMSLLKVNKISILQSILQTTSTI